MGVFILLVYGIYHLCSGWDCLVSYGTIMEWGGILPKVCIAPVLSSFKQSFSRPQELFLVMDLLLGLAAFVILLLLSDLAALLEGFHGVFLL